MTKYLEYGKHAGGKVKSLLWYFEFKTMNEVTPYTEVNPIINWFCAKRSSWSSGSSGISRIEVAGELAACVPLEPISSQCQVRDVWPKEPIWSSYDGLTNSIRSNCCELTRQFRQPATQTSSVIFHDWVGKCLATSKMHQYLEKCLANSKNASYFGKCQATSKNVSYLGKCLVISKECTLSWKMAGNLKKCILSYLFDVIQRSSI